LQFHRFLLVAAAERLAARSLESRLGGTVWEYAAAGSKRESGKDLIKLPVM
jgi:hypothetical protein